MCRYVSPIVYGVAPSIVAPDAKISPVQKSRQRIRLFSYFCNIAYRAVHGHGNLQPRAPKSIGIRKRRA
jgi:hypothetical protein